MDLEQRRLTHANLISMTPAPKLNLKKRTCGISSNVAIAMQHNPDNILHWQQSSPLRLHSIQRDQLMMFLLVGLQRPILSPFNRNELMTNAFVGNVNWRTYALLACHESSSFVFSSVVADIALRQHWDSEQTNQENSEWNAFVSQKRQIIKQKTTPQTPKPTTRKSLGQIAFRQRETTAKQNKEGLEPKENTHKKHQICHGHRGT